MTLIAAMRSLEAAICILLIPCARLGYESSSNEWAGICSRLCVTTAMIMLALSNNLSRRVLKRIGLEHWLVLLASCVLLILFALMWTWLCSETTWSSAFFCFRAIGLFSGASPAVSSGVVRYCNVFQICNALANLNASELLQEAATPVWSPEEPPAQEIVSDV